MQAWEFPKSHGFFPPGWDWSWANTFAPGSSLALGHGLWHISKGKGAHLTESYAANALLIGLKEHKWYWSLTWVGQFLCLVFFLHDISWILKDQEHYLGLPFTVYFSVWKLAFNLSQSIHLFAKKGNEYKKSMICQLP